MLNISNRVKSIQDISQADELIKDIDQYITQNESTQLNDLKTLSNLSKEICGLDKTVPIYSDNISLFQSFFKLKSDILVVSDKLKMEEQRKMMEKLDEESEARKETSGVSSGSDAKTPSPLLLPKLSNGNQQQGGPSETSQYEGRSTIIQIHMAQPQNSFLFIFKKLIQKYPKKLSLNHLRQMKLIKFLRHH